MIFGVIFLKKMWKWGDFFVRGVIFFLVVGGFAWFPIGFWSVGGRNLEEMESFFISIYIIDGLRWSFWSRIPMEYMITISFLLQISYRYAIFFL